MGHGCGDAGVGVAGGEAVVVDEVRGGAVDAAARREWKGCA